MTQKNYTLYLFILHIVYIESLHVDEQIIQQGKGNASNKT